MSDQPPAPRGRPPGWRHGRKGISLYLTPAMIDAIDQARGTEQDRNEWIRQAIQERLQREQPTG